MENINMYKKAMDILASAYDNLYCWIVANDDIAEYTDARDTYHELEKMLLDLEDNEDVYSADEDLDGENFLIEAEMLVERADDIMDAEYSDESPAEAAGWRTRDYY
jgi:hypothetical protein